MHRGVDPHPQLNRVVLCRRRRDGCGQTRIRRLDYIEKTANTTERIPAKSVAVRSYRTKGYLVADRHAITCELGRMTKRFLPCASVVISLIKSSVRIEVYESSPNSLSVLFVPASSGYTTNEQIPAYGYGEDHNLRYLVMSRLGPDVEAAQQEDDAWSLPRKVGYARQMLALLRDLHEKCKMVFVDVKPGTIHI